MTIRFQRAAATALFALVAQAAFVPAQAGTPAEPKIRSASALVMDQATGEVLYSKNESAIVPIASITKLMTAMVTLDAGLPLDEEVSITREDLPAVDAGKLSVLRHSALRVGDKIKRDDLLKVALMASENRAAAALGISYPGGLDRFVDAMNAKAQLLGMSDSRFVEPTGLSEQNVSSAGDLVRLVEAAHTYPLIREYSTSKSHQLRVGRRKLSYFNTNRLVSSPTWDIGVQKTGFIRAAGRCLVMQVKVEARPLIFVLLDSVGKYTRIGDANRLRQWLEATKVLASDALSDSESPKLRSATAPSPRTAYDSGSDNGSRVSVQYPSPANLW
jgi:serine-type D-Ala-D-Ala endopeptidase (penicillin-binding protein 7)